MVKPLSSLKTGFRRLFAPIDIASIVFFRVFFGAIMMWEVWRYFSQGHISGWWIESDFHATYLWFDWVKPWPGNGMYYHFAALGVLAFCIMTGFFYRLAMPLFFLGFTYVFLLDESQYLNHFYLVCLLSLLLCFIPAHRSFSLDVKRRPSLRAHTLPAWTLWLLRFQIGIPYFYGGLAKINGDWLRGEPMRIWLNEYSHVPVIGPYLTEEWSVYLFAYGGLIFDLAVVFLLLWPRTRVAAYILAVTFHLTNSALFDIGIFPWFMIVATTLYFEPDWPRNLKRLIRRKPRRETVSGSYSMFREGRPSGLVSALLALYAAVQLLVPFRHFLYPGNIQWTAEGYHFSWHMKMSSYQGKLRFVVTDKINQNTWAVDPREYVSERQALAMPARPDVILQLSHFIAEDLKQKGRGNVEVRAEVELSLNGRRPQWLIDPTVDLAAKTRTLAAADWFMPLVVPLHQKIYVDEEAVTRNTWHGFEIGVGIIIEERALDPSGRMHQAKKKQILSSIDGGRPFITTFPEGDGRFDETGNTFPVPLGKIPEALYFELKSTRQEAMDVGGRSLSCQVKVYEFDDPVQKWMGRLEMWHSPELKLPYRDLETIGPRLALGPDVVQAVISVRMDQRQGTFKRRIVGLQEVVSMGHLNFSCAREQGEMTISRPGQTIDSFSERWLSDQVPGHVVRLDREVTTNGVKHAEGMIVRDIHLGTQPDTSPIGTSLVQAMKDYYRGMSSDVKEEQVSAVRAMLPDQRDFSVLFPADADKLWQVMAPALDNLIRNTAEVAEATRRTGSVQSIETIDIRRKQTSGQSRAILELIPKDIPAYLVVTRRENGSSWTGPYFFVNGRWIRIPGFESIPQFLSRLD